MAMLEINDLTREFTRRGARFAAVDHVSFSMDQGELVAIIGRSGNGKSTLLNLIAGLLKPTSGTVEIDGRNVSKLSDKELSQLRNATLGFVTQGQTLLGNLTVLDNVILPAVLFDPAKKTVGIPRCLMLHKLFPMANAFFKQLGFNVVLTDASDEETVRLAQASAQGETCYPVKLVHGHMAQLLDMDVDYVFMPSVHTIRHLKSTVPHNYACTYMQSIPAIVASELDYEGHGITLLNPLMNLDFGQGAMADVMLQVGAQLGRTPQETARAMLAGGQNRGAGRSAAGRSETRRARYRADHAQLRHRGPGAEHGYTRHAARSRLESYHRKSPACA